MEGLWLINGIKQTNLFNQPLMTCTLELSSTLEWIPGILAVLVQFFDGFQEYTKNQNLIFWWKFQGHPRSSLFRAVEMNFALHLCFAKNYLKLQKCDTTLTQSKTKAIYKYWSLLNFVPRKRWIRNKFWNPPLFWALKANRSYTVEVLQ